VDVAAAGPVSDVPVLGGGARVGEIIPGADVENWLAARDGRA
jgi:hypothetical protein